MFLPSGGSFGSRMLEGDELKGRFTPSVGFIPIGAEQLAYSPEMRRAYKRYGIPLFQVGQHPVIEDLIAVAYDSRVPSWEPAPHRL